MHTMHQVVTEHTVNDLWLKLTNSSSIKSDFSSLSGRAVILQCIPVVHFYTIWLHPKVMLPLRKYKLKWRVICCEADKLSEGWWGKSSAEDREGRIARGKTEPVLLSKHHNMCWNLTNYICPSPLCSIRCKYWNKHKQNACLAGLCAMQNWIEGAF